MTEAQPNSVQPEALPHPITSEAPSGRGEPYAIAYANRVLGEIFPAYVDRFGI